MQYEVRESARAKHLRIAVQPDGKVVVTKPKRISKTACDRWVLERRDWIEKAQAVFIKHEERRTRLYGKAISLPKLRRGTTAYKDAVAQARTLTTHRVRHYAHLGSFTHGTISIRNQKTRWGSCSKQGNLSFNYRLIYLTPQLIDYLIVHELTHTKEHNHSVRFWAEVGNYIPEYEKLRKELHRYQF